MALRDVMPHEALKSTNFNDLYALSATPWSTVRGNFTVL
jgi:hypothetical protein